MLTSRQHFFFKSPQINFNNKNNISESSQNAKKHCYADVHKMQRTFLSKYSQMQRKHFYANCRCSQTVCQTAQQGGARQRGKGAKLNKWNLTFTISNFSIYTKHYLRHHLRTIQLADERYVKWLLLSMIIFSQQETWCNCFKKTPLTEPHIAEVSLRVVRRK